MDGFLLLPNANIRNKEKKFSRDFKIASVIGGVPLLVVLLQQGVTIYFFYRVRFTMKHKWLKILAVNSNFLPDICEICPIRL